MEKMLGVMLDCSRNAVVNVPTVKKFATILKKMGYNTLMLYTEDTYEVNNQPYFGHLRGRYSKDELKEIDSFCNSIGIELIPCIQTLAHLEHMFKWYTEYEDINDCDNILLAGDDKTYKLIDDMFATLSECVTSKNIHIGMDEAYRVGKGKYEQIHGVEDRFDIINNHLHKVCDIAKKYGLKPMIWSDMFCKFAFGTTSQYEKADPEKIKEKAALPDNLSLVYWDYYTTQYERYDDNIKKNKMFGRNVYFAGGAYTWNGFAPNNDYSFKITKPAVKACNDNNVDGILITMWGDDGSECSKYAVLPALMYTAEIAKGNDDMDSIKKKFKEIVGTSFDTFMLLDKLENPGGNHLYNPSKYLLYNDLFSGIHDYLCRPEDDLYYKNLRDEIKNADDKGEYDFLFNYYEHLADVLSIKSNLGNRTRKAYLENDKVSLKEIIKDYDLLIEKLEAFYDAHEERWYTENKPHGFDIHDIRMGGLIRRAKSCRRRLQKFVDGIISEIAELNDPVLPIKNERNTNSWTRFASPGIGTIW